MKHIKSLIILIFIAMPLAAAPENNFSLNFEYSYDTNVFSDPLPQYVENLEWLLWRQKNPFIKANSLGFDIAYDIYPNTNSRVGFSTACSIRFPFIEKYYIPEAFTSDKDLSKGWDYVETKVSTNISTSFFYSLGPIFKAKMGITELGAALRLSLGTYDFNEKDLILGFQAEPFINVLFNNTLYLSFQLTYDAHLMRFIKDENKIFDEYYQMLSLTPSIGIGIKF